MGGCGGRGRAVDLWLEVRRFGFRLACVSLGKALNPALLLVGIGCCQCVQCVKFSHMYLLYWNFLCVYVLLKVFVLHLQTHADTAYNYGHNTSIEFVIEIFNFIPPCQGHRGRQRLSLQTHVFSASEHATKPVFELGAEAKVTRQNPHLIMTFFAVRRRC